MRALRYTTDRSPKPRLTHPNQLGSRGSPLGRVLAGFLLASLTLFAFHGNAQAQTATLSIDSPSVDEGNSNTVPLIYTVSLDPASGQTVTVDYADAGTGTATVGTDYTTITGATLTFAPNTTTQTFAVTVTGDALDEPNETIEVTLSNPSNAVLDGGGTTLTGTGTIIDDDPGFCDRTAQVKTAILAELSNVSNCSNVTTTHLASITGNLILSAQSITSLQAGDFAGLSSLTELDLEDNTLSSLPATVFSGLSSLRFLLLGNNNLSSLPTGVFSNLSSLTYLSLRYNTLSSLPATVFSDLSSLGYLNLKANQLTSLPTGVFDDLSSLETLNLEANQLTSLPTGVFSNLSSLESLYLYNNNLSSLPTGVFSNLSSLDRLTLHDNQISSLPTGVFDDLSSLRFLLLGNNNLSSLPTGVFDDLSSLGYLYLNSNQLSSLPTGVFDDLSSLETLFLNSNQLSSLPTGVFDDLSSLEILYLYNNNLSSLPTGVFDDLSSLTDLLLHNNQLTSLPTGVFDDLSSLTYLNLEANQLTSLPTGVFDDLSSLTDLRLANNNLSSLPTGVFDDLSSLTSLRLGGNPGAPFTFTMEPERTDTNTFVVRVRDGAPFTMTTTLSVSGGTLSASSVTVEAGSTTSTSITATPRGTGPVVVTLDRAPSLPSNFTGIQTAVGGPLTLTPGVTVSAADAGLTVPEDGPESYTVVLNANPTADVTIAVARATGGDTNLTVSAGASLTFTTSTWNQPQTVTIAAAEDPDGVAGTATITHTASSSDPGYSGITIADVTATEADNDAIGVTVSAAVAGLTVPEGGTADYTVKLNTQPAAAVTITVAGGGDANLTVSAGGSLTFTTTNWSTTQTVTIAAAEDPDGLNGTASFTHTATSADTDYAGITIADVAATEADNDPIGVTVDPIDNLTTTEAGGNDSFTVVLDTKPMADVSIALSSSDPSEGRIVLENQPTGAGTLGLSSLGTSGGAAVSASFTFTPDDWDKPHTVIVTGMDDHEVDGPQSYTIEFAKAISDDPSYNGFDPDDVTVTNIDDEDVVVQPRFRRLNNEILSKHALTLADVTIAAVTSRQEAGPRCADQATTGSLGGQSSLAEILTANAQTLNTGSLNLKQLLGTSSFRLRLTEDGTGPGCLTLWGQGDYRNLSSGDAQALDWDGDLLTGQVGADALLRPDLRAGLAVSWSDGAFDYTDRTEGEPFSGDYSSRMLSVHPYVTWWSPIGLDVWATGGYGQGEIEIEDEQAGTHTSDTTLRLGSVGASGPLPIGNALIAGGTTTLRLKAQASVAQMEVEGNGPLLQEQTIAAQRLRLALEGSHKRTLASGAQLAPSLEVGLRHDGGDGITGTGLELGGGLRYVDPALGLTLEGRGRVLAAYDDAYKEWGASGLIRLDPGAAGQGLSLSLVPSYGQTASGVQRLWDQGLPQGPTQGPSPTQALTGRLEAEVGYGLTAFAGQGLVTPYGQLSLGGGTQQYRVGSRLELGPGLRLSLEGTRQVTALGQANHGIRLQVGWRF